VVVGEFSESKESISAEIEANGGKCLATITKTNPVTHIVLVSMLVLNFNCSFNHYFQGADGYTQYGQKVSVVLPNVLNLFYHTTSRRGEDQRNIKMR